MATQSDADDPPVPAILPTPTGSVSPVDVWRGVHLGAAPVETVPPAVHRAPPSAGSVASSASSVRRRHEAEQRLAAVAAERRRRVEEEEQRDRIKMEEELRMADLRSEVGAPRPIPQGSAVAEQKDVVRRRLVDLEKEAESLRRIIGEPAEFPLAFDTLSPSPANTPVSVNMAGIFGHAKLKIDKPKAWGGSFDHLAREGFIRSATNYFHSVGISPATLVDSAVLGVVRGLFSPDTPKSGGVSPQRWYDSQMDRGKFRCLADVFAAMRGHWLDRGAADRARRAFDRAEQGALKAQEFGALIDSLADECFDRSYSDETRRDRFVMGLRPEIRDFYDVQLAIWQDAHAGLEPSFAKTVELAARSDSLSVRAAILPAAKSTSTLSLKHSSGTKASYLQAPTSSTTTTGSSPATAASRSDDWYRQASEFQARHPMAQKATWHVTKSDPLPTQVKCWNCGKDGFHRSTACPNPRVDLRRVIVAAIAALGGSIDTGGQDGLDPRMTDSEESVSEDQPTPITGSGKE